MTDISVSASILGKMGGKSRSAKKLAAVRKNLRDARAALTPERRREIAKRAAEARWRCRDRKRG